MVVVCGFRSPELLCTRYTMCVRSDVVLAAVVMVAVVYATVQVLPNRRDEAHKVTLDVSRADGSNSVRCFAR
jgi:hypothetical protein